MFLEGAVEGVGVVVVVVVGVVVVVVVVGGVVVTHVDSAGCALMRGSSLWCFLNVSRGQA